MWLDKPDSDGLWWMANKHNGKWEFTTADVYLGNPTMLHLIGSDEDIELKDFENHKWQKIVEPASPAE